MGILYCIWYMIYDTIYDMVYHICTPYCMYIYHILGIGYVFSNNYYVHIILRFKEQCIA